MGGGDLPAQGHQGLAIGLIQRLAIQCRDKVWPNLGGAGQRFVAAKTVHLAVVAGQQHIRHRNTRANTAGLVYWRCSSSAPSPV